MYTSLSMVIDPLADRDRPELAQQLDKALDRDIEQARPSLSRGRRGIAADTHAREAAPPILPRVGRSLGMIPVEVLELQLADVALGLGHIDAFGVQMQHHRSLILAGVADRARAAATLLLQRIGDQRWIN